MWSCFRGPQTNHEKRAFLFVLIGPFAEAPTVVGGRWMSAALLNVAFLAINLSLSDNTISCPHSKVETSESWPPGAVLILLFQSQTDVFRIFTMFLLSSLWNLFLSALNPSLRAPSHRLQPFINTNIQREFILDLHCKAPLITPPPRGHGSPVAFIHDIKA